VIRIESFGIKNFFIRFSKKNKECKNDIDLFQAMANSGIMERENGNV
jgi:hypothetical protein